MDNYINSYINQINKSDKINRNTSFVLSIYFFVLNEIRLLFIARRNCFEKKKKLEKVFTILFFKVLICYKEGLESGDKVYPFIKWKLFFLLAYIHTYGKPLNSNQLNSAKKWPCVTSFPGEGDDKYICIDNHS